METQEDIYTKSEVSNIKCETQLENDDVNNTEFPVTIKNEFKQELLLLEDNTANEDSKDWLNQMNTEIFIENVKHEQIEDNSNLLTCKNLKCEPNIKDDKDVIEENQIQCGHKIGVTEKTKVENISDNTSASENINIISNIQVKSAIESAKRNVLIDETHDVEKKAKTQSKKSATKRSCGGKKTLKNNAIKKIVKTRSGVLNKASSNLIHKIGVKVKPVEIENINDNTSENINIISNIKIKSAIESAKRNLFSDEKDDRNKEVVGVISKIRGEGVTKGLCFSCTRNIHNACPGYKCLNCSRAYHENCIHKHNMFNVLRDEIFKCKTCKTKKN
ncbi:unnamed protein product [Diabrotica balteata]|uniref:Zinc finger PHD-type domain-containing protein n=1 Tax=Diabrotica balteata TaxID=107213 RepID=A0A9N9SN72_DIABA|nr:unnamed protein product [Diabrotica balteata]